MPEHAPTSTPTSASDSIIGVFLASFVYASACLLVADLIAGWWAYVPTLIFATLTGGSMGTQLGRAGCVR